MVPKSSFARPTAASRVDTTASLAAQAALDDLVRDKNGVSVPEVSNLGLLLCGADQTFSLGVTNNSAKEVVLDRLETKAARRDQNVIRLSQPKVLPLSISPGTTSTLEITVHGQNVGHSKDLVALNFGDFKIGSFVEFEVTDPLLSELMPSKPGSGRGPRSNADFNANTQYVPGRRKQAQGGFKPRNYMPRLGEYAIPDHLWRESFENELTQLLDKYPTLGEPLTPANYQTKLSALLHLEEIAMWDRMKMFGMGNVIFQRAGQYLKLEVPGKLSRACKEKPSACFSGLGVASSSHGWTSYPNTCPRVLLLKSCNFTHNIYDHRMLFFAYYRSVRKAT